MKLGYCTITWGGVVVELDEYRAPLAAAGISSNYLEKFLP